jgi:hypothetical protein
MPKILRSLSFPISTTVPPPPTFCFCPIPLSPINQILPQSAFLNPPFSLIHVFSHSTLIHFIGPDIAQNKA